MNKRRTIYETIDPLETTDIKISKIYEKTMIFLIVLSIIPMFFKQTNMVFLTIERATAVVFIIDYLLRWFTADYKLDKGIASFLLYPFTPFAIIDLLSILPVFTPANVGLKLLRLLRLAKAFRALRMLRYSKSVSLIIKVMQREKKALLAVCYLAGGYIVLSGLVMFSVEPDSFNSYFDAFYWAVVTLTTVGYGDVYPTSSIGRVVSMLSSFMGIAVVALPTGIITAGYMSELNEDNE